MLLCSENVNQEALLCYAREAADFGTNYQLPTLDFAMNHCGQPDVAMFDFTNMYASENAALVRERYGHQLLVALVGDSLLEVRKASWEKKLLHNLAVLFCCRCCMGVESEWGDRGPLSLVYKLILDEDVASSHTVEHGDNCGGPQAHRDNHYI